MLVVMALGGDAPPDLAEAARAVAAVAVENTVVVTLGNGQRTRQLARRVVSHYSDSRAAPEEASRVLASILQKELPDRKVASLVTSVEVRLVPIGPHYADTPLGLGSVTYFGWMVRPEGSGFRRVIPTPEPQGIARLETIKSQIEAGVLLICTFGAGNTTTESTEFGLHTGEEQIDMELAAALLAERIMADALILLGHIDYQRTEVNWPKGPAQPLGASSNETLRRFSLGPGMFGPQAEAACRFVESTGKRAAIGSLAYAREILHGDRGVQLTAKESGVTDETGSGRSLTVLVVDDNQVALRLCRRVLEKAGYNVLTASDGLEGVSLALAHSPDFILMDVAMPGMDGLEAMRLIKKQKPGIPIVVASAHLLRSDRERFLALGAADMLIPPFRLTDLVETVARFTASGIPPTKPSYETAPTTNVAAPAKTPVDRPVARIEQPTGRKVQAAAALVSRGTGYEPQSTPGFRQLPFRAQFYIAVTILGSLAMVVAGFWVHPLSSYTTIRIWDSTFTQPTVLTLLYLALGTQIVALLPLRWGNGVRSFFDPLLVATGLFAPGGGVGAVSWLATFDGQLPSRKTPLWALLFNRATTAMAHVLPSLAVSTIPHDAWWSLPSQAGLYVVASISINYVVVGRALSLVSASSFWTALRQGAGGPSTLAPTALLALSGGLLFYLVLTPLGMVLAPVLFGFIMAVRNNVADAQRQTDLKNQTMEVVAQALDTRDPYTQSHSSRVAELAGRLGGRLDLGDRDCELLRVAGSLHDLGKIGIRDDILNKPGRLTDDEWEIMRRHSDIGADVIAQHSGLAAVAQLVRHHHERWDGSGYPAGMKGEVIPFGARIIAVAESFDYITGPPPYRRPMTVNEAVEDISQHSGSWYDPFVVDALRGIHGLSPLHVVEGPTKAHI